MLIQVYHQATDHVDSQIAFSRDGLFWHRPERRPIIPLGAPGEGDSGMVYSWGCGVIELPDGSWGSLYAGSSWVHNAGRPEGARPAELRWATWRPHRLCGVEAPVEGRCTIPTVYRTRDDLRLNYRCRPGGWVSVELLHAVPSRVHSDVDPVSGFTFADCGRLTGRRRGRGGDLERPQRHLARRGDGRHPAAPVPGHGVRVRGVGFPCTMTACTR